jgi:branched-chain amino acid aminotransferase
MSGIIYVNGKLLPEEEAQISVFDRSYLYGEGVFETMRAYNGKVAFSDLHYHRMRDNCKRIRIDLPLDQHAFEKAVAKTLQANQMRDAYVRITASPVGPSIGLFRPPRTDTNMVIYCGTLEERRLALYKQGSRLLLLQTVTAEIGKLATLKSTSYLVRMLGRVEVQAAGADDGLFRNAAGYVTGDGEQYLPG